MLFASWFLFKVHLFYKPKIQERVPAEVSPYSASFSSKVNQYEWINVQHLFKAVIFLYNLTDQIKTRVRWILFQLEF